MEKWAKISLILSIIHFGIVGIFFILLFTIGNVPGPAHPVIIPFFFYMIVSFSIPINIIICCIIGLKVNEKKPTHIICLLLSLIYNTTFFIYVIVMWPKWMGI